MAQSEQQREVELEAMRKADSSWHPCEVSLSSAGGLIVKFKGHDPEHVIFYKEEAFNHLRVHSVPLKGDDCSRIHEGDHVLAASQSKTETLFFDAVVEKTIPVRHSKRSYCRCSFMVKQLREDLGSGTLTVPAGSIMKLASESITIHPVVGAFLNSVENQDYKVSDETDMEYELHGLLEKQILELGSIADVSTQEVSEETPMHVKQDSIGKGRRNKLVTPSQVMNSNNESTNKRAHSRGSTRKKTKMQSELQDQLPAISSLEESFESRSPLSPLAARAALASLVSQLPQKVDFTIQGKEQNFTSLSNGTSKHTSRRLTNGYTGNNMKIGLVSDVKSVLSSKSTDTLEPLLSTRTHASGKLFKAEDLSPKVHSKRRMKDDPSVVADSSPSSIEDNESTQPSRASRLTRSAIRARIETSNAEPRTSTLNEDVEAKPSKGSKRLSRSAARKTKENSTKNTEESSEESDLDETEQDDSEENLSDYSSSGPRKKRALSSLHDQPNSAESNKKRKTSRSIEPGKKTADEGLQSKQKDPHPKKSNSSKQQPLRFSPRPRSRLRTSSLAGF